MNDFPFSDEDLDLDNLSPEEQAFADALDEFIATFPESFSSEMRLVASVSFLSGWEAKDNA